MGKTTLTLYGYHAIYDDNQDVKCQSGDPLEAVPVKSHAVCDSFTVSVSDLHAMSEMPDDRLAYEFCGGWFTGFHTLKRLYSHYLSICAKYRNFIPKRRRPALYSHGVYLGHIKVVGNDGFPVLIYHGIPMYELAFQNDRNVPLIDFWREYYHIAPMPETLKKSWKGINE